MNNKTLWIAAAVIIAIIIIALVVGNSNNGGDLTLSPSPNVSESPVVSASPTVTPKPGTPGTLTYQAALDKYGKNRMQFNAQCQATPSNMVLKNGSALMLDNRGAKATTISFGATKYYVGGYGFRIITASARTFPSTILIDCGTSQNVATVLIQK